MTFKRTSRRALSMVIADAASPTVTGGASEHVAVLSDALAAGADEALTRALTHGFHSYPARMHPATARALIAAYARPGTRVLDPFCGSGTTLVEAHRAGARVVGVDANPLAVAIARARTWTAPAPRRAALVARAQRIAATVIEQGKAARRAEGRRAPADARRRPRPSGAHARRDEQLREWFAPHVRRELEALATQVEALGRDDRELAGVLTVVLSSILYKVSRRASDTAVERVERNIGRGAASRWLVRRTEELAAGLAQLDRARVPEPRDVRPRIVIGDARDLIAAAVRDRSSELVITSPPYPGTYDYVEHHALRLAFLNMSGAQLATREIGARRSFAPGHTDEALARWRADNTASVRAIGRALRRGGLAAMVIGDSVGGARAIYAMSELRAALPRELELLAWAGQPRAPLGGREERAFAREPKREWIALLRRT